MKEKEVLKQFTKQSFERIINAEKLSDVVNLKINSNFFTSSGVLTIDKGLTKGKVTINLYEILRKKYYKEKKEFEIINNIYHELEHTKTLIQTKNGNYYSFEHLISLMEFITYANMFNIKFDKLSFNMQKMVKLKKMLNKNYEVSTSEINASLIGYKQSFEKYEHKLTDDDKKNITQLINVLKLLSENMEICYDHLGGCNNKFSLLLTNTSNYINKYPEVYKKYKILHNLFDEDGTVKKLSDIYSGITNENIEMYKKIMIYYIISVKDEYNAEFINNMDKKFLENIINEYMNNTIDYFKNINLCKIFIDKTKVLTDNLLIKKKNVQVLNKFIIEHNIERTSGLLIGNSMIGNQKTLF